MLPLSLSLQGTDLRVRGMARLSHVEIMLAISMALGVAAWFAESKLWDYAFIVSLVLFVVVVAVSLIKRKR